MAKFKVGIIAVLALAVGACGTAPVAPPIVEDSQTAPIDREPTTTPDEDAEPVPGTEAATASLLVAARSAADANDYNNAIAYLERAVRIDPRNAELWIQLSAAHLENANIPAATQHARKAIALAGQDELLLRDAWLQLANVREAEGNLSEARAIRTRYRAMRG